MKNKKNQRKTKKQNQKRNKINQRKKTVETNEKRKRKKNGEHRLFFSISRVHSSIQHETEKTKIKK